jgi:hypothetical protein
MYAVIRETTLPMDVPLAERPEFIRFQEYMRRSPVIAAPSSRILAAAGISQRRCGRLPMP